MLRVEEISIMLRIDLGSSPDARTSVNSPSCNDFAEGSSEVTSEAASDRQRNIKNLNFEVRKF